MQSWCTCIQPAVAKGLKVVVAGPPPESAPRLGAPYEEKVLPPPAPCLHPTQCGQAVAIDCGRPRARAQAAPGEGSFSYHQLLQFS